MPQDIDIEERIKAIAADRQHGATDLAREALDILRTAAERDGVEVLPAIAAKLSSVRPAMAAIKNAVTRVVDDPAALASPAAAVDASRHVREWLDYSSQVVVEQAAALLPEGARIVTCSFSSAVIRSCVLAGATRQLEVVALESRVRDIAYGERVAAVLRVEGVVCSVMADEGMGEALQGATLVLVGADRVLPSGSLVNGIPSLALAQAAHRAVPFYAICEAFKLDAERTMEPGFDLVPAGLVTGYVTEHGVTAPAEVWAVHQRA